MCISPAARSAPYSIKPMASIWKMGQLSFNRSAVEAYKLDGFKYAILFYDRNKKKIGTKFTNDMKEPEEVFPALGSESVHA
jgi:hypothetical protein